MAFKIRRLSHALGAEIIDLDIRKPLDEEQVAEVRAAFLAHSILLFRGQPLTRQEHVAFSQQLGEVDKNKVIRPGDVVPEYPEIGFVMNKNFSKPDANSSDMYHNGIAWHSDRSFSLIPAKATLLRAIELPEVGGDTMFANCYLAYETLSDKMKKILEDLDGVHVRRDRYLDRSSPEKLEESKRLTRTAQPIVRLHPETSRKSLYLGEFIIKHIVGMTVEESAPLLQFLNNHATRPQFVYRHAWRKDDLVIWDNRCTMHIALGDYDKRTEMRHLEKTYLIGTPSGYSYTLQ